MNPDEVIALLMQEYVRARTATNSAAAMAESTTDVCRYCVSRWQRWEGSKLDGHASCMVTSEFKILLYAKMSLAPEVSMRKAAIALDLSTAIIRSWYNYGSSRQPRVKDGVIAAWLQRPSDQ